MKFFVQKNTRSYPINLLPLTVFKQRKSCHFSNLRTHFKLINPIGGASKSIMNIDSNFVTPPPEKEQEQETRLEATKRVKFGGDEKNANTIGSSNGPGQVPIQSSAAQRVFANAVIIRNILSYVSPSTALALRPVSKILEEEVTSFLRSDEQAQQKLQVRFNWESSDFPLEQGHYEHAYMGTLSDFVENCWTTSRRFPVRNFYFDNAYRGSQDFLDFFTKVGNEILGLALSTSPQDTDLHFMSPLTRTFIPNSIRVFATVLYELTPNLKCLDILSLPWMPNIKLLGHTKLAPGKWILSSLQTLTLPRAGSCFSPAILKDILLSAPNLQKIFDPNLGFTEFLVACQKYHLTPKSLIWVFGQNRQTNGQFFSYAEMRPSHFQKIDLGFGKSGFALDTSPEMGRALSNILQGSCKSLEKIEELPFLQCIDNVEFLGVLEEVKFLRFYQYTPCVNTNRNGMLPPGDTLQGVFPQLKTLELHQLNNDEAINPLFQQLEEHRHDGVTTLKLTSKSDTFVQDTWIYRSALLYPNVTTLKVKVQELLSLPNICRAIWAHFDHLEHLSFDLTSSKNNVWVKLPGEMDSAITGIPLELCKKLRKNLVTNVDPEIKEKNLENVDDLRSNLSILNLCQLKTFKIESGRLVENHKELFSDVSTLYAFRPMFERQKLKVTFGFGGVFLVVL